jgi:cation-transporting ATPase 13A1
VSSPLVSRLTLHNPLPRWAHAYVLPFVPLYAAFGAIYFCRYDEYIGSEEWTFVFFGSLLTLNALAWLCVHWSVSLRALFTTTTARSIDTASLVKVHPGPNQGKAEICRLEHVTVQDSDARWFG